MQRSMDGLIQCKGLRTQTLSDRAASDADVSIFSSASSAGDHLDSFFSCESCEGEVGDDLLDAFCNGFEAAKGTDERSMPSLVTRSQRLLAYLHGLGNHTQPTSIVAIYPTRLLLSQLILGRDIRACDGV